MGILQEYFNEFSQGYWADRDPKRCRCHGSGYALSELDTWHKCPYHHSKDSRHPEDDYYDDVAPPCLECEDGDKFPPTECSKCGPSIKEEMNTWSDEVREKLEDDESHLPHDDSRFDDIPF